MHLRIALLLFILGRGRRRDQRRVDNRASAQKRTATFQMRRHGCENRFRQIVALEQVPKVQDRRLVGNWPAQSSRPANARTAWMTQSASSAPGSES